MNKHSNLFSQILKFISMGEFLSLVRETRSEYKAKGFSSWAHFVAMIFCQIGQAHSLREICNGLASCFGKLIHLGIKVAPKRSTLAYANEHRPWELFEGIFYNLLSKIQGEFIGEKKFKFHNKLLSFDATLIELCARMFDWARYQVAKGAIKLHLLLDHEGYLPEFAHITEGRVHEINILRQLRFSSGAIVVIDRGCIDYELFGIWTGGGVFFVTRAKDNFSYEVIKRLGVPKNRNIKKDEIIKLRRAEGKRLCPYLLRRIEVEDKEKEELIVLLTNHLDFGATTISAIYKDRWQIEIFFKMLKQNLKIKTFVGTSANAIKIQIWSALIVILILKYLKMRSEYGWSMSNLIALLRFNLFTYRDLWEWINNPTSPPPEPDYKQMGLGLK